MNQALSRVVGTGKSQSSGRKTGEQIGGMFLKDSVSQQWLSIGIYRMRDTQARDAMGLLEQRSDWGHGDFPPK